MQVLFGMAKGSIKLMGGPRNRGWYILQLSGVTPGAIKPEDPRLAGLEKELSDSLGKEYTDQLLAAMAAELGVERNETAIRAVRTSLTGGR